MSPAVYEIYLYLDGTKIGDVRGLAQSFKWARRRTKVGADEIDFSVNDVLFSNWLKERGADLATVLKPYALEARVVRNGVELLGGYLATMPGYSPNGTSATLQLKFDGWLNLLGGCYIRPIGAVTGRMDALIDRFISEANTRSTDAGKGFGFKAGAGSTLASIEHTFDNYKSVKEWICERCDNTTGAGKFDVIFDADRTYHVYAEEEAGDVLDWVAVYPTNINAPSALTISANEVSGFASAVIGIGNGEISSNSDENTAITSYALDDDAVKEFGFCEQILQDSSVSVQQTLDNNTASRLASVEKFSWEPQITLSGRQVNPAPTGTNKIWICDRLTVENNEDLTGMTDGGFWVNELSVSVSANGAETITPTLERYL